MKHYIKDLVYGANDGIVTTFAVVASVIGAGLSPRVILIVGIASLLADGFSMAASSYLGSQSEKAVEPDGVASARNQSGTVKKPLFSSLFTFAAFVTVGFIPLMPYAFAGYLERVFLFTMIATGVALALVGSLRTLVTGRRAVVAGVEMVLLGGSAAALAFFVGRQVSLWTQ